SGDARAGTLARRSLVDRAAELAPTQAHDAREFPHPMTLPRPGALAIRLRGGIPPEEAPPPSRAQASPPILPPPIAEGCAKSCDVVAIRSDRSYQHALACDSVGVRARGVPIWRSYRHGVSNLHERNACVTSWHAKCIG